jgi:hypothetical protein
MALTINPAKALRHAQDRQIAFRVKTDVAIPGAGGVIAGGADTYPAPPALPCHHPGLATSFSPQTRNATCDSPRFVQHKTISEPPVTYPVSLPAESKKYAAEMQYY